MLMNRSISGRIVEIGSDADDVITGDISIFVCYAREIKTRLEHLAKLNVRSYHFCKYEYTYELISCVFLHGVDHLGYRCEPERSNQ